MVHGERKQGGADVTAAKEQQQMKEATWAKLENTIALVQKCAIEPIYTIQNDRWNEKRKKEREKNACVDVCM